MLKSGSIKRKISIADEEVENGGDTNFYNENFGPGSSHYQYSSTSAGRRDYASSAESRLQRDMRDRRPRPDSYETNTPSSKKRRSDAATGWISPMGMAQSDKRVVVCREDEQALRSLNQIGEYGSSGSDEDDDSNHVPSRIVRSVVSEASRTKMNGTKRGVSSGVYVPPHARNRSQGTEEKRGSRAEAINELQKQIAETDDKIAELQTVSKDSDMLEKRIEKQADALSNIDSDVSQLRTSKTSSSSEAMATSNDSEMLKRRMEKQLPGAEADNEILKARRKAAIGAAKGDKKKKQNGPLSPEQAIASNDSEMLQKRQEADTKANLAADKAILKVRMQTQVASTDSDIMRIRRNASDPNFQTAMDESQSEETKEKRPKGKKSSSSSESKGEDSHRSRTVRSTRWVAYSPHSEQRKRTLDYQSLTNSTKQKSRYKEEDESDSKDWFDGSTVKTNQKSRYEKLLQQSRSTLPPGLRDMDNDWGRKSSPKTYGKPKKKQSPYKPVSSTSSTDDEGGKLTYQERLDSLRSQNSHMYRKAGNVDWTNGNWKAKFQRRFENLPRIPYVDTHCHIDFLFQRTSYRGSFWEYMEASNDTAPATFAGCVAVFCNPSSYFSEKKLFLSVLEEEKVWGAVGVHPKSAGDYTQSVEKQMKWMLSHKKVMALGEIGLDYSGTFYKHAELQKRVFARQLKLAQALDMPIVIHCRDAEEDCIEVLEENLKDPENTIIHRHCWTGTWEECQTWMERFPSSYIGLTPLVTHSSSRADPVREVAARLPLNKLLLETDAPYFIPSCIPKDAMKYTHPALAITVAAEVADLQGVSIDEVLTAVNENTFNMYGVKPSLD